MADITLPVTTAKIVVDPEVAVPGSHAAMQGDVIVTLADGTTIAMTRARFEALVPTATVGAGGVYSIP